MSWYIALLSAVLAALLLVGGAAALVSGWVMPWQRGYVHRTGFFGWGQLMTGAALALQASTALLDRGSRSDVHLVGIACLLGGLALLVLSKRPRPHH
ncbi:hypothetical protein [Streptomyces sp. NPDC004520]|uniref:hypothetical protein n=1 Tax=unclassified Streptomyces TaxID=2593676 RepID=UPI0036C42EC9